MTTQALLIIDLQKGLFPPDDSTVTMLTRRINGLASRLRARGVPVIFVQHCGAQGSGLHPSEPGHTLLAELDVAPGDHTVKKEFCDAFLSTSLADMLTEAAVDEIIITGAATDFCVDTTVRSAMARGYKVIVPADGHTAASDRPHLAATKVIEHHNFVWANLVSPVGPAMLSTCDGIA